MIWQAPCYDEIKMDAEIGSYQPDTDSPPDRYADSGPVVVAVVELNPALSNG